MTKASKRCKYSQEYLGLRARQNKLKATKCGHKWVTTIECLNEYIDQIESIGVIASVSPPKEIEAIKTPKKIVSQRNHFLNIPKSS